VLVLLTTHSGVGWGQPAEDLTLNLAGARRGRRQPMRSKLVAKPINNVRVQARHIQCALQSLAGGISPDGGGCPVVKVVDGVPSGFPDPQFSKTGSQYNENNAGWTTSGVLDNSAYAAGDIERWPISNKPGHVREINGDEPEAGGQEWGTRGGLGTHCGCAICPCRGDDDLDSVSNGEYTWPVQSVRTKPPVAVRGGHGGSSSSSRKKKSCPGCQYIAHVKPVTERFLATVVPESSSSSSSSHSEKTITKYKTKYVTKYKTVYKARTVYVPVYDDPFWNPEADGRIAGEGIGLPEASPYGALPYKTGAWYEWGNKRHNMLDALGGTLDTDTDVDQPADLGVWWGDSLPSGKMKSSLSDSDSF